MSPWPTGRREKKRRGLKHLVITCQFKFCSAALKSEAVGLKRRVIKGETFSWIQELKFFFSNVNVAALLRSFAESLKQ